VKKLKEKAMSEEGRFLESETRSERNKRNRQENYWKGEERIIKE